MRAYTVDGKGHRALLLLTLGPATKVEMQRAAIPGATVKKRRQLYRLVDALRQDGFTRPDPSGLFVLTQAGVDALTCLGSGQRVVVEAPVWAP